MTQLAASVLDRNLAALLKGGSVGRDIVERLSRTPAHPAIRFEETADGVPCGTLGDGPQRRQLCSRYRPLDEAREQIEPVDLKSSGAFVVAGFGMGYHVAELARWLGPRGLIVVYEPQIDLLRSVLERVDHSAWLGACSIRFIADPNDAAAMTESLSGNEGMVGIGVELIQHPPSTPRLGESTGTFYRHFTSVVEAVKMTVVTTLGQSRITIRNLLQNADVYSGGRGIAWLTNACKGKPAIVVAAGPSLQRNIDLLTQPGVRESCVIIAVQTVLKTLLAKGIRPHFVTALDYSEINRRFYEGLTKEQVEGITLVVEPKVNPSVVMAWPGEILCAADKTIDLILGPELAGENAFVRAGATVAHLSYYLARHLGCEPVALVGQDLGFTDGQYYAAGAAIHNVWGGELNAFKSLELMEWQRIVRMGQHLRPATDQLGRPIYTDVQMLSYLRQFEQDFRADVQAGRAVYDCTEGGVRKQHTEIVPLSAFLKDIARLGELKSSESIEALLQQAAGNTPCTGLDAGTRKKLRQRMTELRRQVGRVADLSRKTAVALSEIIEHQADQQRVNRIIDTIDKHRAEIDTLKPGFTLVNLHGQTAIFNRVRADRQISFNETTDELERQKLRVERDLENVRNLARAADDLASMLDDSVKTIDGAPRITRDMRKGDVNADSQDARRDDRPVRVEPICVTALVCVDLERSSLGWQRRLDRPIAGRQSILALTIERVLECKKVRDVVIAGSEPDAIRKLLPPELATSKRVRLLGGPTPDSERQRAIAAGRAWARSCWRGGLGDLTCYDEVFDPVLASAALQETGADGVLLLGADWCAIDPALCDAVIARHEEDRAHYRATFTQAVPGLGGMFVSRSVCEELAPGAKAHGMFSSIGGLVGYLPVAPAMDVVGQPICLGLDGPERDAGLRLIADTPWACEAIEAAYAAGASNARTMAAAALEHVQSRGVDATDELVIDEEPSPKAIEELRAYLAARPWCAVTIGSGRSNPLAWASIDQVLACGQSAAAMHIRVPDAACDQRVIEKCRASNVQVVSVDLFDHERWQSTLERLHALRGTFCRPESMGVPWIVPRLVRSDATYPHIEPCVNAALMAFGWCALDANDRPSHGDRIQPLPLPPTARARFARARLRLDPSTGVRLPLSA